MTNEGLAAFEKEKNEEQVKKAKREKKAAKATEKDVKLGSWRQIASALVLFDEWLTELERKVHTYESLQKLDKLSSSVLRHLIDACGMDAFRRQAKIGLVMHFAPMFSNTAPRRVFLRNRASTTTLLTDKESYHQQHKSTRSQLLCARRKARTCVYRTKMTEKRRKYVRAKNTINPRMCILLLSTEMN